MSGAISSLWNNRALLILQSRLVFAAMACIYLGSFAALRRPPSASPRKKRKTSTKEDAEDDDDEADDQYVQGLELSDAIVFPLLAGTVLVGLYYLIKWLEDPAILNKILGVYFSFMSLASMGKLFADSLHFLTGLVFPDIWRASDGTLYHFDTSKKCQYRISESGEHIFDETRNSPFAGPLWAQRLLPDINRRSLWQLRHLLQERWTVRFMLHGVAKERFRVRLNDIVAIFLAVGANMINYTAKSNIISNIMGYAFSYTGIIMMSPTTFTTGSAVLFALFFYDIYMVFYTPYMVTVATKLEVPIKLVFQSEKKSSMLGLGDIVIPGMFIAICLRFDNFMHYYRQRKFVEVDLKSDEELSGELVTCKETRRMVVKPEYVNPQGQWGNRFWATRFINMLSPDATPALKASAFRKTYFHAAMVGYFLAMLATLTVLFVFKHAQPALLYLVPGVVFSVWLTAFWRGELHEMWTFTEDGSLDKTDVVVDVDANGKVVKELSFTPKKETDDEGEKDTEPTKEEQKSVVAKKRVDKYVFAFTVEAPASLATEVRGE
ncbi:signal peptide peptidase-domain-containing protein [Pseudomassariella vexata]|uniref:Signal peptide peptidase-domain-containing protein n=1 Tax=Pseudomassariella vexata TaxID=1141098 RepID=A0A1Y2E7P1_9PEZI|nr:signal peptide peptidase-domain-containing protein [Pseudomassariella vexata]ORY67344.1 signal peptide peptidase-domain-containing protein [Pseudomassariella vexata]